jgi:hypothetical protein
MKKIILSLLMIVGFLGNVNAISRGWATVFADLGGAAAGIETGPGAVVIGGCASLTTWHSVGSIKIPTGTSGPTFPNNPFSGYGDMHNNICKTYIERFGNNDDIDNAKVIEIAIELYPEFKKNFIAISEKTIKQTIEDLYPYDLDTPEGALSLFKTHVKFTPYDEQKIAKALTDIMTSTDKNTANKIMDLNNSIANFKITENEKKVLYIMLEIMLFSYYLWM